MDDYSLYYDFIEIMELNGPEAIKYANEFFRNIDYLDSYLRQFILTDNESRAIEELFGDTNILYKVEKALEYDEFCFEALIIKAKSIDDEDLLYDFYHENYQKMLKEEAITSHTQENILLFMNSYADFLYAVYQSEDSFNVQCEIAYRLGELDFCQATRMFCTLDRLDRLDEVMALYIQFADIIKEPIVSLNFVDILYEQDKIKEAKAILDDVCYRFDDVLDIIHKLFKDNEDNSFYDWLIQNIEENKGEDK